MGRGRTLNLNLTEVLIQLLIMIGGVSTAYLAARRQIVQLSERVKHLEEENVRLKQENAALKTRVSSLEGDVNEREQRIEKLWERLSSSTNRPIF